MTQSTPSLETVLRSHGMDAESAQACAQEITNHYVLGEWATVRCATHDGVPTTPEEDEAFDAGYDPCMYVLRLDDSGKVMRPAV